MVEMDENNRADSEKRSRLGESPPAKRIKKVLKRNERDDLSLGTRLIMETGNGREKKKSINRSRYEARRFIVFPGSTPSVIPRTFLITKEKSIEKISTPYIYIYIRKTNKFPRGCLKYLKG